MLRNLRQVGEVWDSVLRNNTTVMSFSCTWPFRKSPVSNDILVPVLCASFVESVF